MPPRRPTVTRLTALGLAAAITLGALEAIYRTVIDHDTGPLSPRR